VLDGGADAVGEGLLGVVLGELFVELRASRERSSALRVTKGSWGVGGAEDDGVAGGAGVDGAGEVAFEGLREGAGKG